MKRNNAPQRQNRGGAGPRLAAAARSDLHDAGMHLFNFFESMLNPEDQPPQRVPDSHSATSAVFKTPFVVDLPYSGRWDPVASATSAIDPVTPVDGYSEVILCPGSTDCYFYTLGIEAIPWSIAQAAGGFTHLMVPILATHPVDTDIVQGQTQLNHGLRTYNCPGANDVCVLPKLNSVGLFIYELALEPVNLVAGQDMDILIGFFNVGVQAPSRTTAEITLAWNSGGSITLAMNIASTGDNNTGHSSFYLFQTTLPANNDFVISFNVEVVDVDPASHWKFSLTSPATDGFGLLIPARSATAFHVVDAPEMDSLSETLSERTTALTGLLTYMGSTLADGGQVAGARLGMGLSPLRSPNGDTYKYLASLPFYNDDFALREGIYAWWLPDSVQEHFYVPYRNPRSDDLEFNAVLQYSVLRDDPAQAVRLKVIQNLEVITRSRLYTSVSGPNNPAYSTIIGAIKAVPAVTINKKHIGILGRAFNWVKSWVSKPTNWKKLVKGGASVIQRLAPGTLPARMAGGVSGLI